ncbi:MAG: YdcF family protein [Oscillospiraceae bacterium]|nr:YdcF family protein [Oscillospiraceae bacterium]
MPRTNNALRAKGQRALRSAMTSRNVRRRRRKWARLAALALCLALCFGLACASVNVYMARAESPRILPPEQAAAMEGIDCVLVLGAKVMPSGAPSHMLEDRCRRAVALYGAGAAPVLLMSGDHGQWEYDEVTCMKQYAVDHGVPSGAVFMDHAGFSTYDSMYRARDVFGAKKILIVTQRYHLFRALYIARRLGLEAYGVSCDYRAYATQTKNSLREAAARCKDFAMCAVKPKPKYLGPPIPLTLDGDVTNDKGVVFEKR